MILTQNLPKCSIGVVAGSINGLQQKWWRDRPGQGHWANAFVMMARSEGDDDMGFGLVPVLLCEYFLAPRYWQFHEGGKVVIIYES